MFAAPKALQPLCILRHHLYLFPSICMAILMREYRQNFHENTIMLCVHSCTICISQNYPESIAAAQGWIKYFVCPLFHSQYQWIEPEPEPDEKQTVKQQKPRRKQTKVLNHSVGKKTTIKVRSFTTRYFFVSVHQVYCTTFRLDWDRGYI